MNPVKAWATPARQALTRHKWRWIAVAASISVLSWLALGASIVLEVWLTSKVWQACRMLDRPLSTAHRAISRR